MVEALLTYGDGGTPVARVAREGGQYVFEYLPAFSRLGFRPFPGLGSGRPGETHRRPVEAGLWQALGARLPSREMEGYSAVVRATGGIAPSAADRMDELERVLVLAPRMLTSPFVLVRSQRDGHPAREG